MMRWMVLGLVLVACDGGAGDSDTQVDTDPGSSCQGLGENSCPEVAGCISITGTPINGSAQYAGCATDPGGCNDVLSAAEAPDGTCWDFTDSCIPDGWSPLGGACGE